MRLIVSLTAGLFLFSLAVQTLAQPTIPREQIPPDSLQKVVDEIKHLYSDDPGVRGEAASSLGSMGDTAQVAIPHLLAMFHDDSVELGYLNPFGSMWDRSDCPAKRAALALAKIGGPAVDSLLSLYNSGDEHQKLWSVCALAQINDPRTTPPLLEFLAYLTTHEVIKFQWKIERDIVFAFGKRRDTSAVDLLINIADDKDSRIRGAAARSLGRIGDRRAVLTLIRLLEEFRLTGCVAYALARINDPQAIQPLLAHLSITSREYNRHVMMALGDFNSAVVLDSLIHALRCGDTWERFAAARALGATGGEFEADRTFEDRRRRAFGRAAAVEPLIEALQDSSHDTRREVIRALGAIGDKRAIVPLYNAMKSDRENEGMFAKEALIEITGEDFRQYDGGHDKWIQWKRKWIPEPSD